MLFQDFNSFSNHVCGAGSGMEFPIGSGVASFSRPGKGYA
jgi:hypothetical protein